MGFLDGFKVIFQKEDDDTPPIKSDEVVLDSEDQPKQPEETTNEGGDV